MSFIRAKEIPPRSGNWYDYEVKTISVNGQPRQKVIRYIGRSSRTSAPSGGGAIGNVGVTSVDVSPASAPPARIHKMKTPAKQVASALGMYYGGMSLDAIQAQFKQDHGLDMSETSYWNWVERFTREAVRQSKKFQPDVGDYWVADETYLKQGKRTVYFWDIIDEQSRFLLASHVSFTRGKRDAIALMKQAQERAGKAPKIVLTDGLVSYPDGVEQVFGADSLHRAGGPFDKEFNTSQIERFHRTLKQRTRVFQKHKDIDSIRLLTDGWLVYYNFFKQNEGCGNIPPAQAMSKVVPFKDWNDIVRSKKLPDIDYKVALHKRESVKKGYPVLDAVLTPFEAKKESA